MNLFKYFKLLVALVLSLRMGMLSAQQRTPLDSLLSEIETAKEDSNKVLLLLNIGREFENERPLQAKDYYRQARDLSQKIGYNRGILKFAANYTYLLNMEGKFDSSLAINLQAVDLAFKINDKEYQGKSLFNTGTSYNYLGEYKKAIEYYLRGRPYFEGGDNILVEGQINDLLQTLNTQLGKYDSGIAYGRRAVVLLRKAGDGDLFAVSCMNLANNFSRKLQNDSAFSYLNQALSIARLEHNLNLEATVLINIIHIELNTFNLEKIKERAERILWLSGQTDNIPNKVIAYRALGIYYLRKEQFEESKKFLDSSLNLASAAGLKDEMRKTLEELSNLHYAMHDYKYAAVYLGRSDSIGNAVMDEKLQLNIQDLEKKYETQKKEATIQIQRAEIGQRKTMNYLFAGGAAALLIILLLSLRTYHQKQKLQKQRISELETEQRLSAAQSVLKGEEQERARLAKDLHDGLSGMLSGVKYSLQDMKGNLIMTEENRQAFERSMDMLDSSIQEMRRVAHNMMPEVLVRYGLDAAMKDYVAEINKAGMVKVVYQSMGLEDKEVEKSAALAIYRIVQELLNNVIKHARATEALVQLFNENDKLVVNVEDNGKGFDTRLSEEKGGMGWRNIRSRVELLNGKIDLQSSPDKGTAVNLEFNIA